MHPLRLVVIGSVGVGISLFSRAASLQLLGWRDRGDPRAEKWAEPGELRAWKLMLPTSIVILVVGVIAMVVDSIS